MTVRLYLPGPLSTFENEKEKGKKETAADRLVPRQ